MFKIISSPSFVFDMNEIALSLDRESQRSSESLPALDSPVKSPLESPPPFPPMRANSPTDDNMSDLGPDASLLLLLHQPQPIDLSGLSNETINDAVLLSLLHQPCQIGSKFRKLTKKRINDAALLYSLPFLVPSKQSVRPALVTQGDIKKPDSKRVRLSSPSELTAGLPAPVTQGDIKKPDSKRVHFSPSTHSKDGPVFSDPVTRYPTQKPSDNTLQFINRFSRLDDDLFMYGDRLKAINSAESNLQPFDQKLASLEYDYLMKRSSHAARGLWFNSMKGRLFCRTHPLEYKERLDKFLRDRIQLDKLGSGLSTDKIYLFESRRALFQKRLALNESYDTLLHDLSRLFSETNQISNVRLQDLRLSVLGHLLRSPLTRPKGLSLIETICKETVGTDNFAIQFFNLYLILSFLNYSEDHARIRNFIVPFFSGENSLLKGDDKGVYFALQLLSALAKHSDNHQLIRPFILPAFAIISKQSGSLKYMKLAMYEFSLKLLYFLFKNTEIRPDINHFVEPYLRATETVTAPLVCRYRDKLSSAYLESKK